MLRLAAAIAAALALSACSGGGGTKTASPTSSTAPAPIGITISSADGVPGTVQAAVKHTLDLWLQAAIVGPLRTGVAATGLDALFTPGALAQATGADKAALIEDAAAPDPGASTSQPGRSATTTTLPTTVTSDSTTVKLVPLAGPDGNLTLVAATVNIALTVVKGHDRLAVVRTGDVVLVSGDPWKIDSYDVVAKRDSIPPPVTTTTRKKG